MIMQEEIRDQLQYAGEVMAKCAERLPGDIAAAARIIFASLRSGGTAAFCGNGGNASQAQHLAGELVGRFLLERPAYRGIALTADTSILTSVGNDYGYTEVFSRQVEGLLRQGDVLVALSTSGNSENCLRAVDRARELKIKTVGLSGAGGGKLAGQADHCIVVPSYDTPQIQEAHLAIGHAICRIVERALAQQDGSSDEI
jgi:D-sedoheptulose 7-phosphate isomerase